MICIAHCHGRLKRIGSDSKKIVLESIAAGMWLTDSTPKYLASGKPLVKYEV
jgi:hypothetical protein